MFILTYKYKPVKEEIIMKYMYLADNESLMAAGVFYYYMINKNNCYTTSGDDFIVFNKDGDYNHQLVDSLYNEEINVLGFIPDEKIINTLLAKGNKIYHHIVLEQPKPVYSASILSNKSYKTNVYYSTQHDKCNSLHLWNCMFPKESVPSIIGVVNNNYKHQVTGSELSDDELAIYSYISTLDSSNPSVFASLISQDIRRTISYTDMINTGNIVLRYANEALTRGVITC